jgi:hypothetical protein
MHSWKKYFSAFVAFALTSLAFSNRCPFRTLLITETGKSRVVTVRGAWRMHQSLHIRFAMYFRTTNDRCAGALTYSRNQLVRDCFSRTMTNSVFWDVTPFGCCENRRFGGTYRLHHQGDKNRRARNNVSTN